MATQVNGVDIDVLNQTVATIQNDPELGRCKFRLKNRWIDGARNLGKVGAYHAAKQDFEHQETFEAAADEPPLLAGSDSAPNPVEHLLISLASCLTTSMVAHAAVRGIQIEELESQVEGEIDLNGFLGLGSDVPKGYQEIRVQFAVKSDADTEKLRSLAAYSPVLNTLLQGCRVAVEVEKKQEQKEAGAPRELRAE